MRKPEVKHKSQILIQKRKLDNIKCNHKVYAMTVWQPIPQKPSSDPTYSQQVQTGRETSRTSFFHSLWFL